MKRTLLFVTLSIVFASPAAFAKSELETLRSLCSEQERQIRQLEDENSKLQGGSHETHQVVTKSEPTSAAPAKAVTDKKPYATAGTTTTYVIVAGDTIEKIARKVGTNPEILAKSNGITVNSVIHPGQKLKAPGVSSKSSPEVVATLKNVDKSHKAKAGETVSSISKKHNPGSGTMAAASPNEKSAAPHPSQVNLGDDGPSTTMISASVPHSKVPTAMEKAPVSAPATKKSSELRQNSSSTKSIPSSASATAANKPTPTAAKETTAEKETPSPTPEKKIRPVTIDGEMTYGEFAIKHGTDAERLNALNGLDLTTATVLAKGSELYVPAQP